MQFAGTPYLGYDICVGRKKVGSITPLFGEFIVTFTEKLAGFKFDGRFPTIPIAFEKSHEEYYRQVKLKKKGLSQNE